MTVLQYNNFYYKYGIRKASHFLSPRIWSSEDIMLPFDTELHWFTISEVIEHINKNSGLLKNISKGIVNVATIAVYGKDNTDVTTIVGNNIKETSASWNGKSEKMTTEAYVDKNGELPSNAIPYIISSQTVINSSDVTESEVDGKKLYSYTIALHPLKSVVNYIKQVKQTSGLSDYPTFNDITIDVVIDENWNFVKFNIVENYRVVYSGLKPKCKGVLNIDFTVNQPVTLPEYKD